MKTLFKFLKTTFLGGFFFLLPLMVVVILVQEGIKRLAKLVKPLGDWLQLKTAIGIETPYLLALVLLLLVCFLAGLAAKTKIGASFRDGIDRWLSVHIPGYVATKKQTKKLVGESSTPFRTCGLVKFGESWSFVFLMDQPKAGWRTVFVPVAPGANSGSVQIVPEQWVQPLDANFEAVSQCLGALGSGSKALLERALPSPAEKELTK